MVLVWVLFSLLAGVSIADPIDWCSINYALGFRNATSLDSSMKAIIQCADRTARYSGSIVTPNGVRAPSDKPNDYLSWAPYHWPDCNWCKSHSQFVAPSNDTRSEEDDPVTQEDFILPFIGNFTHGVVERGRHRTVAQCKRHDLSEDSSIARRDQGLLHIPGLSMTSTSSSTPVMGTANPAQAAKQTKTQNNACKPSPTKPMPPSATWTTCPYIRRDGKVNPDVRTLPGVGTLVDMPQAAICQALAFIFTGHPSYCKQLISITSTFFLSESTRMNPSMDFGQIVRGPPPTGSQGTFTGILDFRGIIKVCNAILLIQNLPCSDWTDKWENKMWTWMKQYLDWLLTSPIGIETSKKPNNHATFYYVQVVCIQILLGDTRAAIGSLEKFFDNQFQDQLSRQGDQPFEAARTRPYHYRCFNFEALTALCKLGDQLGQNYWTRQAKTGATLKTIGDFMLNLNPRGEDMDDCLTSMAAVSAAYGDPDGLYQRWMTTASGDYQYQRFWFSMSTLALPNSPAGKKNQGSPAAKKGKRAEPEVSGLLWWWCPPEILKSGGIELTNGEFGDCEAFCRSCVDAEEKLVHKCIFGP